MKKDFKAILNYNGIIEETEVLTLDYNTETGHGTIKFDMVQKIPCTAHDMKLILDIISRANDPKAAAAPLYDYIKKCLDFLNLMLEKTPDHTDEDKKDRAELTNIIKKYNRNLDALLKVYDFEKVETVEAVKMQNVNIVKIGMKNGAYFAENKKGKKFKKAGHVFHVYKNKKDCYILVPCTGYAAVVYNGLITDAPEFITNDLIEKLDKINFEELQKRLLELVETSNNIVLNDDIYKLYNTELKNDPEENQDTPKEETATVIVKDHETIINAKTVIYNNTTYTITNDCTNNYIIACDMDYITITENIDLVENSPGITDDKKLELLQVYKLVAYYKKLPNYTPPAPAAETQPTPDDSHDTPRHSEALQTPKKPPYYIMLYIPSKHHITGTKKALKPLLNIRPYKTPPDTKTDIFDRVKGPYNARNGPGHTLPLYYTNNYPEANHKQFYNTS